MKIAFGTDEATPVTDELLDDLRASGHQVVLDMADQLWADTGTAVGRAVASGEAEVGIVFCFTGTGVSMAANKVPGVRAALCTDAETAKGARKWNDANVLALSLRLTTVELGQEIISTFLDEAFDESEAAQVQLLGDLTGYSAPAGS